MPTQFFDDGSSQETDDNGNVVKPAQIATYLDAEREGVLLLGLTSTKMIRVSNVAHVEIELKNDFDKQRHKSQNFGRKKFLGITLASIGVDFVVLPDEEAEFWDEVVPLFRPRGKNGVSTALQVFNYQINRVGITLVNVLRSKIGPPSPKSGRKVSIQLEEFTVSPAKPKDPPAGAAENIELFPGGLSERRAGIDLKTPLGANQ
jgi:hypothetical protein